MGFSLKKEDLVFCGVYEHIYNNSDYNDISIHYINLAFECQFNKTTDLPKIEHESYTFYTIEDIMSNKNVHENVKDYFRNEKGIK